MGPACVARREPCRRDNPRWSVGHEWLPPKTADAAGARTHSVGVHGRGSTPCGRLCHSTQSAARRRLALRRRNGATGESSLMAERPLRSEAHTSELQSLMRISYAVFCLKNKSKERNHNSINTQNSCIPCTTTY